MTSILQIFFVLGLVVLLIVLVFRPGKKSKEVIPLPDHYRQLLAEYVTFYRQLDAAGKERFEQKMQQFLSSVRITGVNTSVEDVDKVLVGASAIIPIYAFPDWEYTNLDEVLLYPDAFSREFDQAGHHRSITGMVGTGPLQNEMILSKQALRQGFMNTGGNNNTGIHEFAHLIDKTDGSVDGVPEILLKHQYVLPWINMMQQNMQAMMKGKSDIDLYGLTNQAEFFAVVSEYFFKQPKLFQQKHPDLYAMMEEMFLRKESEALPR